MIKELTTKIMRAYVSGLPMKPWYWPTFFPVKPTPTLRYTTLLGERGAPVMADLVSFGSPVPQKRRDKIDKFFGEITKTGISRKMDEDQYNDYIALKNQGANLDDLLDFVYNDIDFCYRGVMARLEWVALQAISSGTVSVTTSNNEGVPTTTNIDFKIPAANQFVAQTAKWDGNPSTATPIEDLIYLHRKAKDAGVNPVRTLMRQDDFYNLIAADEIKNTISPILYQGTQTTNIYLGLDQVNAYLTSIGLPAISIIDQNVQYEVDQSRTSVNPWEGEMVAMIPATKLGNMLNAPIAEEGRIPQVTESRRRNVLLQKYATPDPFAEITKGITNSFPMFSLANEMFLMDVSTT